MKRGFAAVMMLAVVIGIGCGGCAGRNSRINAGSDGQNGETVAESIAKEHDEEREERGGKESDGTGATAAAGGTVAGSDGEEENGSAKLVFEEGESVDEALLKECQEYAALVESYAADSPFGPAADESVKELEEFLSGHYEVAGRRAADGKEYYLAARRSDAPVYEDFYELSLGYVDGEFCQIGYYNEKVDETALYKIPGYMVNTFLDREGQKALDLLCLIPDKISDDRAFLCAFQESGRKELDFLRKHPGLSLYEYEGSYIDFYYQDEETIKFWSEPYDCFIRLAEPEIEEVKELLNAERYEDSNAKQTFANSEEAFGWVRKQEASVRSTGAFLHLDGDTYRILGSRDSGGYLLSYESDSICVEMNEKVYEFVLGKIHDVVGRDYGDFTDTWFDSKLVSASLQFPRQEKGEDGRYRFQTYAQTVTEREKLDHLSKLLGNAVRGHELISGCPYTGVLDLQREDGETIQMFVAADSCDSIMYEGRIGFEYGDQKELAEIFDEAMNCK